MKKLRLEIEELRIDSFETDAPAEERGTVAGHMITQGANTCYHCTRFGCPATGLCL
jgi:tetrahydromethanopterin S-methyltransferase subunit E